MTLEFFILRECSVLRIQLWRHNESTYDVIKKTRLIPRGVVAVWQLSIFSLVRFQKYRDPKFFHFSNMTATPRELWRHNYHCNCNVSSRESSLNAPSIFYYAPHTNLRTIREPSIVVPSYVPSSRWPCLRLIWYMNTWQFIYSDTTCVMAVCRHHFLGAQLCCWCSAPVASTLVGLLILPTSEGRQAESPLPGVNSTAWQAL